MDSEQENVCMVVERPAHKETPYGLPFWPHLSVRKLPAGLLHFLSSDKAAAGIFFAGIWNSCWDLRVHLEELPGITAGIKKWECISVS